MRYSVKIFMWLGLVGWWGFSVGFAETTPIPIHTAIEQAKLATVGILQSDQPDIPDHDHGLPMNIRGSGIHIGHGVILTARHAVERSDGGKVVIPETIHVVTDDLLELPAIRQGANAYLDVAVYQLQAPESDWPQGRSILRTGMSPMEIGSLRLGILWAGGLPSPLAWSATRILF